MGDSFADLWNSSAPLKPTPPPQKLGSISTSIAPKRPQNDAFSLLSSAGSSAPGSRSITPASATTYSAPQKSAIGKPTTKPAVGGDAFSELLGGTISANHGARMTMAERAAKVEQEKRNIMLQRNQQAVKAQPSAWDGLDTLANSPSLLKPSPSPVTNLEDDWGFGVASSQQPKAPAAKEPIDDWGLGDFSSAVASSSAGKPARSPQPVSSNHARQAIWDLDDFSATPSPSGLNKKSPSPEPPARSSTPGDFDFGNREDGLLDNDDSPDEVDDDILGALSKPVDATPKRPPVSNRSSSYSDHSEILSSRKSNKATRPTSPPPHILGQIVEMGFSVQQARVALASTETGVDVQAALDTLLSNGASGSAPAPSPATSQRPPAQPRRPTDRLREQSAQQSRERIEGEREREKEKERNIQEQADKILAQASEIGLNVFNRANAFWKEGKERVQKVYEERSAAAGTSNGRSSGSGGGRPKWMQDAVDDGEDDGWKDTGSAGFSDDVLPQRPKPKQHPSRTSTKADPPAQAPPPPADLFSSEPAAAYISPFRRGKPKQSVLSSSQSPPPRAPSPVRPQPRRNVVSASQSSITQSAASKTLGSEKFKLGQYADSEAAYTRAISFLPASHLLLVPLHNNRALTRLKTGDYSGAVDDATQVLEIIGAGYRPDREQRVERVEEGREVDLGDGWVKALKRRAEAWEGREKWEEAGRDWEAVAVCEWAKAGMRGEAVRGAGRCRRMVKGSQEPQNASSEVGAAPRPAVKPKPAPKRRPVVSSTPSEALSKLRSATDAAEAENQERHELKDSVDARLMGWKGGKETNIRALIASLDTVLWPELGLQKVGMADLVSPSQVKIRYTRTIAKLHPDKLNANNTTVEQRMIANGVFGALNEAWIAFKQ